MAHVKPGRAARAILLAALCAHSRSLAVADGADPVVSNPAQFGPAELATDKVRRIEGWLARVAPECAARLTPAAAEGFLGKLRDDRPGFFEQLPATEEPPWEMRSALLQFAGSLLAKNGTESAKEAVAARRIALWVVELKRSVRTDAAAESRDLVARLKKDAPESYRRLVDGWMDDDELSSALARDLAPDSRPKLTEKPPPTSLTANDIAAEFSRRNQAGSAFARLRAYKIEAVLKPAVGAEQHLLIFRLRPNRFRLEVCDRGATKYILAGDGRSFWQQSPGGRPQAIEPITAGRRRLLGEFADPLFFADENEMERLEDGVVDGKKVYRISVRRADGSRCVAAVDPGTARVIERVEQDGYRTRYADFREIAGVTLPFRQEVTDSTGRTGVYQIISMVPNPGLVSALFDGGEPVDAAADYFRIEQLWRTKTAAAQP